jgi:hypothetical protein
VPYETAELLIDDLAVARRSLEAFGAEGQPFEPVWMLVVGALAFRETFCFAEVSDSRLRDHGA